MQEKVRMAHQGGEEMSEKVRELVWAVLVSAALTAILGFESTAVQIGIFRFVVVPAAVLLWMVARRPVKGMIDEIRAWLWTRRVENAFTFLMLVDVTINAAAYSFCEGREEEVEKKLRDLLGHPWALARWEAVKGAYSREFTEWVDGILGGP